MADEAKKSSPVLLLLLVAGGVAIAIVLSSRSAAAAESAAGVAGDQTFSAPPADSPWNPEVGDTVSGQTPYAVTDDKVVALANAIATAEGFYSSDPNAIPRRGNNPGDLTVSFGLQTLGVLNSEGVLQFASLDDGWTAIKTQARMMLDGSSHIYTPFMTFATVGKKYAGGDPGGNWARNAAGALGLTPDNTLEDFLAQ